MTDDRGASQGVPADCVVAILCPGSVEFAGGVGRCVSNLMDEMPRADPGLTYRFIDTRGSRHIAFSPIYFAAALSRLARLAAFGHIDVIHANVSARGSTLRKLHVALLARVLCIPFVLHLHDGRFDRFYRDLPGFARKAVRWMFQGANRVIVLGEHWERFVVDELGVGRRSVDIICNAVPRPSRRGPGPRQEAEPPHLVFLGRLWEAKGVSDLLEALASPGVAALGWRATLAGDGDPGPYRKQVQRLGLSGRVDFRGWQDRAGVDGLLGQATALVLPSHVEGLPMVVLEALARRIPVVVTNVGSLPEYLTHGDSALIVAPRDVGGLSRALAAVIEAPELRAKLAARGEEVYREHFDVAVAARRLAAVYRASIRPKDDPATRRPEGATGAADAASVGARRGAGECGPAPSGEPAGTGRHIAMRVEDGGRGR